MPNVWVGNVHESSSPKKPSLKIVKETQKSVDTQDELGSIILKICKTVPFGVLVVNSQTQQHNSLEAEAI